MNRVPKTRTIFDNYDLWKKYPDDVLKEMAIECEWVDDVEEITDEMLNRWRQEESDIDWDCEEERLTEFFKHKTVGFFGKVGLWDGVYMAGEIGEFWDLYWKAVEDCWYVRIYDENGHLYLTCSHHDGTCHFEIKIINEKGERYLENWEYGCDDRTERYVHTQIFNRYSTIPRFAEKVYGCKPREYEKLTKGKIIDILNNEAKSFYS